MDSRSAYLLAKENFLVLANTDFLGKGIVVGMDSSGTNLVQIYWDGERSLGGGRPLFTISDDLRLKVVWVDAENQILPGKNRHDIMAERGKFYVISNGDQTETILTHKKADFDLYKAMLTRTYNHHDLMPRISAVISLEEDVHFLEMSVLRKSILRDESCDRRLYRFEHFSPGLGYCITTHSGITREPNFPFREEPYLLPLEGGMDEILESFWATVNRGGCASVAVKFISLETGRSVIQVVNNC